MKRTGTARETKDGRLVFEWRFSPEKRAPRSPYTEDYEAMEIDMAAGELRTPSVGERVIVAEVAYVGPNDERPVILSSFPDNGEGWPGNSEPRIKLYHGWRGTTDDWAVYAHGVREVLRVERTGKRAQRVVVEFGRDLVPDAS